jgi:hypothetical protein
MKQLIVILLILAVSGMAFGARKALVIGNAKYADKPLRNPINDADLMAATLGQLDFSVVKLTDVNYRTFSNAVRDFANNLDVEDEVVFYYSGHGVQVNGENYLLPVSESFNDESDFEDKAVALNWITAKLNSTAITMVFLDACRDNPFSKYRSSAKGLAMAGAGNNIFMMYSTEAGSVANDGKGKNSDFTYCLAREMQQPGLSLDDISTNVTAEVRDITNNEQRPWKIGSLSYKYYFTDPAFGKTSPSDHYAYSGRSSAPYMGRVSSTVEERIKHTNPADEFYNPKASRFVNVLCANEMLVENFNNDTPSQGQFVTRNAFGLKLHIAGIEGFYNVTKTWHDLDFDLGNMIKQAGAGIGFTDPQVVRLFVYGIQTDLSEFAPYESYAGLKAEFAKRFRTEKQFTEIGGSYEMNYVPDNLAVASLPVISSYFAPDLLDWTPNRRYRAYLLASSLNNRYLEPNSYGGLGPAFSPLLLANMQSNAFIISAELSEHDTIFRNTRNLDLDAVMPLNFNKYFSLDVAYKYNRLENLNNDTNTQSSDFIGGMRLAPLSLKNMRLIGGMHYDRYKQDAVTEYLDFSGNLVIKFTHHFAVIGLIKHRSIWQRELGFTEIDPQSFYLGSSVVIRL